MAETINEVGDLNLRERHGDRLHCCSGSSEICTGGLSQGRKLATVVEMSCWSVTKEELLGGKYTTLLEQPTVSST